jgi:hypothetical protein
MKLPNAHLALVEREKLVDYLLNPAHPDNGGKAAFFFAHGFQREEWQALATALLGLAATGEVIKELVSPHGRKYVLDGPIETPARRQPVVRTVWIVDHGTTAPRLVTAYPN